MRDPAVPPLDVFRREMAAAAHRLINALQLENEFSRLLSGDPRLEVLEQWRTARRLVEHTSGDYTRSVQRYREALRDSALMEGGEKIDPATPDLRRFVQIRK